MFFAKRNAKLRIGGYGIVMSMDHGSLSVALHAAAGDDAALVRELRQALVDSAHRQIDLVAVAV